MASVVDALKNPTVRAIEKEAKARAAADGGSDAENLKQRFAIRNELRAEQGLAPEQRKRGGLAGAYDEGFLLPAAAIALGPLALAAMSPGGVGGATIGGAGSAGGSAASMGGLPPIPAAGGAAGGAPGFSLGGLAGKAGDFLKDPKNLLKLGAGLHGISQQQKGAKQQQDALNAEKARWAAGAPLREAGRAGMLDPVPAVDTSRLSGLASRGNPFALPPMPVRG